MMIPSTTTTYSIYFGTNGTSCALAAASIVGNLTCAATISVIPNPLYSCFSYEYSIDGGALQLYPFQLRLSRVMSHYIPTD